MKRGLYWFRNDLRLEDNPALEKAYSECQEISFVYLIDGQWTEDSQWGFSRMGDLRKNFLIESVEDLRDSLEKMGEELIIEYGNPQDILPQLMNEIGCHTLYASSACSWDEMQVEERLAKNVDCCFVRSHLLFELDKLPFSLEHLPEVFSAFRRKVEKSTEALRDISNIRLSRFSGPGKIEKVRRRKNPLPAKRGIPNDHRTAFPFKGGRDAALKRIASYFWESGRIAYYKKTRNGLIGTGYSSKLSPWLALGSISSREVYAEVENFENERFSNESTYWLKFELLWREYFQLIGLKHGRSLFLKGGLKKINKDFSKCFKKFKDWKNGRTGQDFIDANMIELKNTGWMSNRGRQNAASYFVHNLGLDWRMGAAWFEAMLVDYDPCSNYANWQYVAGLGNDPRPSRIFNPKRQAEMYDGDKRFRRKWLGGKDQMSLF